MTPQEYINNAVKTKSDLNYINQVDADVLHAALGISTESAELLDAIKKKMFYNKPIDYVNCDEEIGDLLWYIAIYLNAREISFEQVMKQNIAKLKSRYPDKFTSENAINRNVEKERIILENTSPPFIPTPSSPPQSSTKIRGC